MVPSAEPQEPGVQPSRCPGAVVDLDVPELEQAGARGEEVTADSIGDEFPQVTTGAPAEEPRPIEDPELARAAAELDAHQAERQAAADAARPSWRTARRSRPPARRPGRTRRPRPSARGREPERMGPGPGHAVLRRPRGHHGRACPSGARPRRRPGSRHQDAPCTDVGPYRGRWCS